MTGERDMIFSGPQTGLGVGFRVQGLGLTGYEAPIKGVEKTTVSLASVVVCVVFGAPV